MGKTAIYLGFFCIYSVILLIMGKGSFGGNSTPEEYFICERKVGLRECVCTFTGTWISAITILSLTGSVYEEVFMRRAFRRSSIQLCPGSSGLFSLPW